MDYVRAINVGLRGLNKRAITDETTAHPDVDLVKEAINEVRDIILARGYWFNEEYIEITPDETGRYRIPDKTLTIRAQDQRYNYLLRRGDYLINTNKPNDTYTDALTFKRSVNLDWDDIHVIAQTLIAYRAAEIVVGDDDGDQAKFARIATRAERQQLALEAEEINQRNVNANDSPYTAHILAGQLKSSGTIRDGSKLGG
jgi:hypothetical protein